MLAATWRRGEVTEAEPAVRPFILHRDALLGAFTRTPLTSRPRPTKFGDVLPEE
jgi:hypothetical protein